LTEELLKKYEHSGAHVELIPSTGGVFEVEKDGQLIFSKKQTGRFPEAGEVVNAAG